MRLLKPPLSFIPNVLLFTKQDDLKYIISADGFDIGWLVTLGAYEIVSIGRQYFTDGDKDYLISAFLAP